ncbi:MAG TPA: hypothetical protein DCS93_23965 [Microscillaceae bacterium]|nr:hypothetical protein [Microscillaceae bacterium]
MIIILDDTFIERHKFNEVDYLQQTPYVEICTIHTEIKTTDLGSLVKTLSQYSLFCYHKTLQLLDAQGKSLNNENNLRSRENLVKKVQDLNIPMIEFSRGLETRFENKQINKDLFYTHLRVLLDYFMNHQQIELKTLFWGADFENVEKMTQVKYLMTQVRLTSLDSLSENESILQGIALIYDKDATEIVEAWKTKQFSTNDIINEINQQIR